MDEVPYTGRQPGLGSPQILGNGNFQFTLIGEAGRTRDIEASTNLVNWVAWMSLFNSNGTVLITDTTCAGVKVCKYRAGGEGGIRTPGTGLTVQRFSKPSL